MNGGSPKVGERIRMARKQKRLTLQRFAKATGLSIGFLSQVERDITAPSLASLAVIARELDLPVGLFLDRSDIPNAISRREGRVAYALHPNWVSYERLSTALPGHMLNAHKMNVPPLYVSEESSHEGEEIVYVLAGTIRYVIDGTIYELTAGDSLHFSAARPHYLANPAGHMAELVSVSTQPLLPSQYREGEPAAETSRAEAPPGHAPVILDAEEATAGLI
jgi:transcriptional regulator with XRE-family HTH domain